MDEQSTVDADRNCPAPAQSTTSAAGAMRPWWPVAAGCLYTLVVDLLLYLGWNSHPALMRELSVWAVVPAVLAALIGMVFLVRRHPMAPRRRTAWVCLTASFVFILLGVATWAYQVTTGTDKVGGWDDLIYWFSFPLSAAAMALFFVDVGGSIRQPVAWLDAAILAIAFGVVMWEFDVRPNMVLVTGDAMRVIAAAIYSSTFVLTAVFGCLCYIRISDWRAERALGFLAAAALANVVAECMTGGETAGTRAESILYDTAYLAADIFVLAALITESQRNDAAARTRPRPASMPSTLPALAILLAIASLILVHVDTRDIDVSLTIGITLLGALLVAAREISTRYGTYRSHRERALREAEVRMTELIRRSRDVIAVVGASGTLTYVSPAATRVLGIAPERLVGLPPSALVGRANAARMTSYLVNLNNGRGEPTELDCEIALPSGERRVLGVVASDQRTSAVIGGIALTLRDATSERRAERAMLDEATRERGELSSVVHEGIAQDLTGISLLIQSLRPGVTPNDGSVGHDMQIALDELGRTIGNVRRLATTLAPVRVARGSLSLAVKNLAADASSRTGLSIVTHSELTDSVISEVLREDAYRIVREALECSTRDSGCTRVHIRLDAPHEALQITVQWDGDEAIRPSGPLADDGDRFRTIAHRVQRLRGTMRCEQTPGGGTLLLVQLPHVGVNCDPPAS